MKKTIILTESKLLKAIESINESADKTIYMQLINGYLYPTNGPSEKILSNVYHVSRLPEDSLYRWFSRLVHDGYKLAINDYNPPHVKGYYSGNNGYEKIGGEVHPVENPCKKCKINGLCGDECGRKR